MQKTLVERAIETVGHRLLCEDDARQVAKTIIDQIRTIDKWSLGAWAAREYQTVTPRNLKLPGLNKPLGPGVVFKVRGSKMLSGGNICVSLDTSKDTYDVVAFTVRGVEVKNVKHVSDVHAEDLVEVIDDFVG